jgi:hypothetical protein
MSHYGATQQLMSVVEQQSTQIATLLEQNSTLTHLYGDIPPLVVEQQSTQIATLLEQNSTLTHLCGYIPQLMNAVSTLQG